MKKRNNTIKRQVVSRNALTSSEPQKKKRIGKKEKRKYLCISTFVLLCVIAAYGFYGSYKAEKLENERKEQMGTISNSNADKKQYDSDGNEIVKLTKTEIMVFNANGGNATLIKKGDKEVLIDAGCTDISKKVEPYISGNLDYLIITNNRKTCTLGLDNLFKNCTVDTTFLPAQANNELKKSIQSRKILEINNQNIDMGENAVISTKKGEKTADGTTIIVVKDGDYQFLIAGNASMKAVAKLTKNQNGFEFMVTNGISMDGSNPMLVLNNLDITSVLYTGKEKVSKNTIKIFEDSGIELIDVKKALKYIVFDGELFTPF